MSTSHVNTKAGPAPEEWQNMKDRIYRIYIVDGRTLTALMLKMESEFGFKATAKMYNTYFKKWEPHFDKNTKKGSQTASNPPLKGPRTRPRRVTSRSSNCSTHQHNRELQPKSSGLPSRPQYLARYNGFNAVHELLHENETSLLWNKALFYFRLNITGSAESDPRWASVSKFDYPGASKTYNTFYCAILHIKANDYVFGGRFLRRAFQSLYEEVSGGSLDVIQDVCLNIVGTVIRNDDTKMGIRILKYCLSLLENNPTQRHHGDFVSALLNIIGQNESQSNHYLSQLSKFYAVMLEEIRGPHARSTLQAQRWHHLIIRDSEISATAEEVNAIITAYQTLLLSAVSELGSSHDTTMRIENEMLSIQHYRGTYQDNYITRLENFMSNVERLYGFERGHLAFERWEKLHQSAFLRYQERMFDYYRYNGDLNKAMATARRALAVEGYKTERWAQFSLQFEHWLWKSDLVEEYEYYQQRRLNSRLYRRLEEEFAEIEAEFLRRVHSIQPIGQTSSVAT